MKKRSLNVFCTHTQTFQKTHIIRLTTNFYEVPNKTSSQYTGVCWHKDKNKWRAQLTHNKKKYSGEYFDNEEHAAMKVNLLCDKYKIRRKNPRIDLEPDVIQQVMHSFYIN